MGRRQQQDSVVRGVCSGYDWSTHQANLRDVSEFGLLPPESGWSVARACEALEPPSFRGLISDLARLRSEAFNEGLPDETTLPERIATVAAWNLERDDLEYSEQCGAAWAVIPTAMVAHGWTFRNDEARVVIYRARVYFFDQHGDVASLSDLLHTCFIAPHDRRFRQRVRFRALLDRREHEQTLKREVALRSRNPPSPHSLTRVSDSRMPGMTRRPGRR